MSQPSARLGRRIAAIGTMSTAGKQGMWARDWASSRTAVHSATTIQRLAFGWSIQSPSCSGCRAADCYDWRFVSTGTGLGGKARGLRGCGRSAQHSENSSCPKTGTQVPPTGHGVITKGGELLPWQQLSENGMHTDPQMYMASPPASKRRVTSPRLCKRPARCRTT